jgi:hypothetical protein
VPDTRVAIDAETLGHLYIDERLTIEAIAALLACSASTVGRRLRTLAIPTRQRGPDPARRGIPAPRAPAWSPEIAWVVGLDRDRRQSRDPSSEDLDHLDGLRSTGSGGTLPGAHQSHRAIGRWMGSRSVSPAVGQPGVLRLADRPGTDARKSLTLGPLAVPDEFFADFFRGCIDGDGTVLVSTRITTTRW